MKKIARSSKSGPFVLGRASFEKISAVEGIRMSADMKRTFKQLDEKAVTPVVRRKTIAAKFGRSS